MEAIFSLLGKGVPSCPGDFGEDKYLPFCSKCTVRLVDNSKIMSDYLLQWGFTKRAKSQNQNSYDVRLITLNKRMFVVRTLVLSEWALKRSLQTNA